MRRGDIAPLVEHLHDDRSRRQHETHGRDEGHERMESGGNAHPRQKGAAHGHLNRAEAEDLPPEGPQAGGLHLQSDHEQEHDHAQLRNVQNRLRIGEQAEPVGPNDETSRQIAQHGTETEAPEERDGNHRCAEQSNDSHKLGAAFCRHASVSP